MRLKKEVKKITEGLDKVDLAENIVQSLNEIDSYSDGDKWEIKDTIGNYIVIQNESSDDYMDGLFWKAEVGDDYVSCFRSPDQEGGDFVLIGKFRSDDSNIINKIEELVGVGGTEFYNDEIDESRKSQCKKIKKVTEGWVSDESHSLWYSLANSLAHDLNCDVWINDIGWMELSKDEEQLIQIYVRWNGGRGELVANKDAKEQKIGQCGTDRLPEASYIANRLVSMGLWEL
jgi:hypothetical protein